jgi:CPA2 family monovalent cation:H+ antiporter-2
MHGTGLEGLITNLVVILTASILVLFASHKLRLSSVAALLLTGMLIGPSGLELIQRADVEMLAEIGVALLLFTIGLEVSLVRLRSNLAAFLVGGGFQVGITLASAALLSFLLGASSGTAIFLGFLAALSSTAVVLKMYADRQELQTPQGTLAAGILLFQDFCLAPMILLVPVLAGGDESNMSGVFARLGLGILLVSLVFLLARTMMPRLFDWIVGTRIREVFVLGALAFCLAMALLTEQLGFSFALGAFLAGLILSESEYSHQVFAEILPFRDLFNSIFFISVGMLLDLTHFANDWLRILALGAALVVGKAMIITLISYFMGYAGRIALLAGLSLAQIGEFSFVLGGLGVQYGLLQETTYQAVLGAAIVTLLLTPFLIQMAPRIVSHSPTLPLPRFVDRLRLGTGARPVEVQKLKGHVIVVGFGLNGTNVSRVLKETAIPFVTLELSGALVRQGRRDNIPVAFGDATRPEILTAYGVTRASMLVVAISDMAATRQIVRSARNANRDIYILVRTRRVGRVNELMELGANEIIPEEFETSIEIFNRVLERYHVPRNVIDAQERILRDESYEFLRAGGMPRTANKLDRISELLEGALTQTFLVRRDSPAIGRTLRDLDLRKRSGGATVIAVVRKEQPLPNPSPTLEIEVNDTLVLVGNHGSLEAAVALLSVPDKPATDDSNSPEIAT